MADLRETRWGLPGVLALAMAAWVGVVLGRFQYDDLPNLVNDPVSTGATPLHERLVHGIRPLTRLSHVLDHAMWQMNPGGWLLDNWVLHLITVVGVFTLLRLRRFSSTIAAAGAALFALQPAHGMTVAYASGRAGGLMTLLCVYALVAYEKSTPASCPRSVRRRWTLLSLLCFGLALLAKETALCFPLLLVLWESTRPREKTRISSTTAPSLPYLLLALVGAAVALANDRYSQLLSYSLSMRTPLESLATNASALPATLSLLVRPWALSVLHETPESALAQWAGAVGLGAWVWFALCRWRHAPWLALGMLWPVVALLPSHSFVAKSDAVSENNLYLCWVGPSLAIAVAFAHLYNTSRQRSNGAAVLAIASLAALCVWRTWVWSDPVRLWNEAALTVPTSARAWNNLGMARLSRDDAEGASAAFDQALLIDPQHAGALSNRQMLEFAH